MIIVAVQSLSCVHLFATLRTVAHEASLSFTISWSLLELLSIELVMPSNRLILCHPLLPLLLIFPSIKVFWDLIRVLSEPVSWLFASDGQSIEASASVLPVNIQDWFPLGLTSLISMMLKGLSRIFFSTNNDNCVSFLLILCFCLSCLIGHGFPYYYEWYWW